ncbi:portal protein [Sinorhizobium alkalisoli]|uniref:portal protein n=1 Tax=Sinorhizobium alkalisoli TaxID=1752398 RepID=UPI00124C9212|nr:phage portal protein [Sinorhizobium alkalisoli]MCA1491841.1 phage portal protein [Ensifer sp. NBAIM29]QFI66857.1 Phage portal protein [Sinorhizobium alkalisoli]
MAAMTDERLCALVSHMVKDCESYRDALATERIKAMEYYDGTMRDVPADANRSKVVSRDVRAAIKKVLPSLIRTILGNDKVVEYQPVGEGDEAAAEQATDYINYVVFPESNGYDAVQDAAHDALKLRNGVIRWWYEKKQTVCVSTHTGLDEAALVHLVGDDDVEVLEQSQTIERIEPAAPRAFAANAGGLDTFPHPAPVAQPSYSVKIRRRTERGTARLAAVPLEEFLIHPDAISIEDSPITGIAMRMRRSDLIAMGYDRDMIERLPASTGDSGRDDEGLTRRRDAFDARDEMPKALEEVDYYELYVTIDADDDGIAELRRLVFAGGTSEENLLSNEEWDEVPFADLIIERRPHQREGGSVTDDLAEIQRVKTVLMRQTLDNLYWQNNQQPIVQEGAIANPEAVLNPKFGQPIRVSQGIDARAAVGYTMVPFVAKESFAMLSYLDQEATDRTGISDASSGLAPDALTNMTARATALIEQAGIGQTELMVRTFAQGLRRVFKGLLRLTIKHQDRPRAVRLRGQWVTFDPRHWNAEMDATVNTGLGAGTRERDMMMIQLIQELQEKLLTTLGPDNPYVSPDNLYNGIAKSVEAAGLKSPELYFTKPTPEEIRQRMQAAAEQPNPEILKLQMRAQAEAEKARLSAENERRKLEIDRALKLAEIQQKGALKRYQIDAELELKREQNVAEMRGGEPLTAAQVGGMPG